MEKIEARDWVPGPAYFEFMQWVRAADLEDVRRVVKILGDHPPISMAKAMRSDPVFGVGQDLDQVFEAVQADAKLATENAKSAAANACSLWKALYETEDESATA